jgi:zinc protease
MKNIIVIALSFIALSCSTLKQATKPDYDQILAQESWRHELPSIQNTPVEPHFPKVLQARLKNGLRILVVEDPRLPIVEISLVFKNGSALDPIGKAGLMNLTALMLKEGTKKLTSLQLAEAFANLGTEVRVGATKDMASISSGVLSNKFNEALSLISAMAQNPRLDREEFSRIKLQQEHSINSEMAMPAYVAQVRFLMSAYGKNHPYAYPSAGTQSTLKNININDIKKAQSTNFGPNNAALIVVGDVKLNQITKAAEHYFGHWKEIKDPVRPVATPTKHKNMQTILISRSMPQTFLLVGQPAARQSDKDLATFEVFQNILAGMPTSRLGMNLRERKGWTYGVHSSLVPLRGLGPLMITTSIQVPYGADALKEILAELQNMKKHPVSQEELQSAKNGLLNSFASRYSTHKKIASSISEDFIYDLSFDSDKKYYQHIARVTPQKIMALAQKAFPLNHMIAVAVGELEVMEIPLAKMKVGQVIIDRD